MEEKENVMPEGEALTSPAAESIEEGTAPAAQEAAADSVTEDGIAPEETASDGETAAETTADEETLEEPLIAADWRFGAAAKEATPVATLGSKRFFGVFGAVVALCIALLIVTLWVGDAGIKIYRTLTHERTVFVQEKDNGASGLLAPEQAADLVKKSTVTVTVRTETGMGSGSGFVYSAEGYICTNQHVVENAITVQVMLPDGETVDATVVGIDEMADLAVLKIEKEGLVPAKLGSSAAALVGETVVAVGTPAKIDYAGTATFGKISATNRTVALTDASGVVTKRMTLLQTDASVNPGNSGGPLANMYGEVIGIVVMKVTGNSFDGIGFAIPIDGARIVLDAIIKHGKFEGQNPVATSRSLLGISGIGIVGEHWYSDPASSDRIQSKTEVEGYTYIPYDGVYVVDVNGTNAAGKLQKGDIITKINGLNMYTVYDVIDQVNRYAAGETVTATVKRPNGNEYQELKIDILLLAE